MQLHRTAALLAVLATASFAQKPLTLAVGALKSLKLPGLQRVALGDPAIADVKTFGHGELLVSGLSAGHTTLLVWRTGASAPETFEVTVSGPGSVPPAPRQPEDVTPPPTFSPTLKVGEQVTKTLHQVARIAVGDPAIADLRTAADAVTVVGAGAGQTTVLVWFEDGRREQWQVTVLK